MTKTFTLLFLYILFLFGCRETHESEAFSEIFTMLRQKDYFTAQETLLRKAHELSPEQQDVLEAIIFNAFNEIEKSEETIRQITNPATHPLSDSVSLVLLDVQHDNAAKSYQYKMAKDALSEIIDQHASSLSTEQLDDYRNSLKLWTILQDQPPQKVAITAPLTMQMTKDAAGLNNLSVSFDEDSIDFIFDTGANISTVTRSTAARLAMEVLPDSIQVGTITGSKVYAQLAVCPKMSLGSVQIGNAIFLVFDDEHLAFPQINYQINGIIGFPIIEALGEIQITRDGTFVVPMSNEEAEYDQNMSFDHLTPIIRLDGKHYNFDTGADETIFFKRYFDENREQIESAYELTEIQFGGAGGQTTYPGYRIDFSAMINNKRIQLSDVPVLKEEITGKWDHIYGNVGQDVIRQFDKMTMNFRDMYVVFE